MTHTHDFVEIRPDEAKERGLTPVSIRVDASAVGMSARKFPASDVFLKLSGPPGAPLVLMIWDCCNTGAYIESIVRSKFVPAWTQELELGAPDHAQVLGEEQAGVTFATGSGQARIAWFGFVIERSSSKLLVTIGVGGRDMLPVSAAEVVSNPAIVRLLEALTLA